MTENQPSEEPDAVGDAESEETPEPGSLAADPISLEPKGYPDAAESGSEAQQKESISGEEEDFLS